MVKNGTADILWYDLKSATIYYQLYHILPASKAGYHILPWLTANGIYQDFTKPRGKKGNTLFTTYGTICHILRFIHSSIGRKI